MLRLLMTARPVELVLGKDYYGWLSFCARLATALPCAMISSGCLGHDRGKPNITSVSERRELSSS
jgi:hypothetical protein